MHLSPTFPYVLSVNLRFFFFRYIAIFDILFQPEILSSARTLTSELHVLSLGGEDEWAKTRGRNMAIFLFNDLIEIAKVCFRFVKLRYVV